MSPLGPAYAVAWNLVDPAAGGNNVMDWGIASINAANMTVNWSQAWTGPDAAVHEDVRDLVLKPVGLGYYATCGTRIDASTGGMSGLVTSVNRVTGLLAYQRVLTPGTGYGLELNSLTVIPSPTCAEYVLFGTLVPNTPTGKKKVFVASMTCAGVVNWSWALSLSNTD
ncbi:MAG: hypothetical protein ACK559_25890, partial [bacterium]